MFSSLSKRTYIKFDHQTELFKWPSNLPIPMINEDVWFDVWHFGVVYRKEHKLDLKTKQYTLTIYVRGR